MNYKVTLCWYGENHSFMVLAKNDRSAVVKASRRLANRLDIHPAAVLRHFSGDRDNFKAERI